MRIELLGPSGVGKTTALRAAQELRAKEPEWIGPLEAEVIQKKSLRSSERSTQELMREAIDDRSLRSFIDHCVSVVEASSMLPSQKVSALRILQKSCFERHLLRHAPSSSVLVHDELLLHRAYSLLLYSAQMTSDATRYFDLVPLPEAAVIFWTDEETILSRVRNRGRLPNIYTGLDESGLRRVIAAGIEVAHVAEDVLRKRGLDVKTIHAAQNPERAGKELHRFCVTGE